MAEEPIGARLFVVGEERAKKFLRASHAPLGSAPVLFEGEAKLRNGRAEVVAGLVHGTSFSSLGARNVLRKEARILMVAAL
jgi:hypothetical protein